MSTPDKYRGECGQWARAYYEMTPEQRRQALVTPRKAGHKSLRRIIDEGLELLRYLEQHPEALRTEPPGRAPRPARGTIGLEVALARVGIAGIFSVRQVAAVVLAVPPGRRLHRLLTARADDRVGGRGTGPEERSTNRDRASRQAGKQLTDRRGGSLESVLSHAGVLPSVGPPTGGEYPEAVLDQHPEA
jgi:hypothetical protein